MSADVIPNGEVEFNYPPCGNEAIQKWGLEDTPKAEEADSLIPSKIMSLIAGDGELKKLLWKEILGIPEEEETELRLLLDAKLLTHDDGCKEIVITIKDVNLKDKK
jgi:hypothetical protein